MGNKINAIICDLDGTLAILNGRNPYDVTNCYQDTVNIVINDLLRIYKHARNNAILIVSGRSEEGKKDTIKWLLNNGVPFDELYMRPQGEMTPGYEFKKVILNRTIFNTYKVLFALEDDPRCVKMYRDNGILCFQVNDFVYEEKK